jgi:hypothetical protein
VEAEADIGARRYSRQGSQSAGNDQCPPPYESFMTENTGDRWLWLWVMKLTVLIFTAGPETRATD